MYFLFAPALIGIVALLIIEFHGLTKAFRPQPPEDKTDVSAPAPATKSQYGI